MLHFLVLTVFTALVAAEWEQQYLEDSVEGRVVGGQEAYYKSWPWQVSLQYRSGGSYTHGCGGILVRRGWVLTAAHCVHSSRTWRVVLGEYNLSANEGREQHRGVHSIHVHPKWNGDSISSGYDIALLRLSSEASLNTYVQLGSLPPFEQILPHNNLCYITGWGRTSTNGGHSVRLKEAHLPIVDHETCTSSGWWGSTIKTIMICAGGAAESGCNGDFGGPLNCNVNGRYVVHGVASFVSGMGCNTPKKPTVFTRVSAYIPWMNSVMN